MFGRPIRAGWGQLVGRHQRGRQFRDCCPWLGRLTSRRRRHGDQHRGERRRRRRPRTARRLGPRCNHVWRRCVLAGSERWRLRRVPQTGVLPAAPNVSAGSSLSVLGRMSHWRRSRKLLWPVRAADERRSAARLCGKRLPLVVPRAVTRCIRNDERPEPSGSGLRSPRAPGCASSRTLSSRVPRSAATARGSRGAMPCRG